MRYERAKMAIFFWLAPRPALAGSLLTGGARAKKALFFAPFFARNGSFESKPIQHPTYRLGKVRTTSFVRVNP